LFRREIGSFPVSVIGALLNPILSRNPQQVLPLAEVALEAHALGDLKLAMTHRSICFPELPGSFARSPYTALWES
jgi:hypothetical protein